MQVLARKTREATVEQVAEMMREPDRRHRQSIANFVATSDYDTVRSSFRLADSTRTDWSSPCLGSGAVAFQRGLVLSMVGSNDEVADYNREYKAASVSGFISSGRPAQEEIRVFYRSVMPLLRNREASSNLSREMIPW